MGASIFWSSGIAGKFTFQKPRFGSLRVISLSMISHARVALTRQSTFTVGVRYCERAIAGKPSQTASRAALHVPLIQISTPRFPPWLIPESTKSGWYRKCRTASRTQSAGQLSTAKRSWLTSLNPKGPAELTLCPQQLRPSRGATVTTREILGNDRKQLSRAHIPSASIPSSLVNKICMLQSSI